MGSRGFDYFLYIISVLLICSGVITFQGDQKGGPITGAILIMIFAAVFANPYNKAVDDVDTHQVWN